MAKLSVQDTYITVIPFNENEYISITDIAKHKSDDPAAAIGNWMRNIYSLKRVTETIKRNYTLLTRFPNETLWSPYFKLWHYFWRKLHK